MIEVDSILSPKASTFIFKYSLIVAPWSEALHQSSFCVWAEKPVTQGILLHPGNHFCVLQGVHYTQNLMHGAFFLQLGFPKVWTGNEGDGSFQSFLDQLQVPLIWQGQVSTAWGHAPLTQASTQALVPIPIIGAQDCNGEMAASDGGEAIRMWVT